MTTFHLTESQILKNYETFRNLISELFPSRKVQLDAMYDELEERVSTIPASGTEHYHNCFDGGYVDHVLRVIDFAEKEYNHWKALGLKVDNFTLEELLFAAAHHDLGKVGLPGDYHPYQPNTSKWHRENQGKLYNTDSNMPFALVQDTSLFLLQHYGIKCTWQEQLAIRTHDGLYDKANEAYFFSNQLGSKPRTNINQILHNADMMAARFEFERWAISANKLTFYNEVRPIVTKPEPSTITDLTKGSNDDIFKQLFGK